MKRVLLIDDDPVVTSIYRNLLRAKRYDVEVANNGEQGLQAVMRDPPDIVLLDLDMPLISGLQFLHRVRKQPSLKSLPIIVFTGSGIRRRIVNAWEAGATQVLYKVRDQPHRVLEAIRNTAVWKGSAAL